MLLLPGGAASHHHDGAAVCRSGASWPAGFPSGQPSLLPPLAVRRGCRCGAAARRSGLTPLLLLPGGVASHQPTEPPSAALAQGSPLPLPLPSRAALCFPPWVWETLGARCCCCWLAGCPAEQPDAAAAAGRSGEATFLCRGPAERPGATAATARRSGLPPTDGAAGWPQPLLPRRACRPEISSARACLLIHSLTLDLCPLQLRPWLPLLGSACCSHVSRGLCFNLTVRLRPLPQVTGTPGSRSWGIGQKLCHQFSVP